MTTDESLSPEFSLLPADCQALLDKVEELAGLLEKNGQILSSGDVTGWSGKEVVLTCQLPMADSLDSRFCSRYVQAHWEQLDELCGPHSIEIGPSLEPHYLSSLDSGASLRLGGRRSGPLLATLADDIGVSLFLLPWDEDVRERLYFWFREYRAVSELEVISGTLEYESYRELANPLSELNRRGRAWAEYVERTLLLPTYYFLVRHYGYEHESPRCPSCGRCWAARLGGAGFICEACRLITDSPSDFSGDFRAPLGTWPRGPGSGYPPEQ